MADPVSIASIGLGASGGGSILGAFGAAMSGNSQANMYNYQAGIAQLQSKIALQNRDYELSTGETQAEQYGLRSRFQMGKIRSAQGASGIDVGGPSSSAVRAGQQMVSDLDLATIRNNTARKAYGYETESAVDQAQSQLYGMASSNVKAAIPLNVASSLLGGASSVSSKWLQANQTGIFS